jgi:hypothetical protein
VAGRILEFREEDCKTATILARRSWVKGNWTWMPHDEATEELI